jgi:hypothetical protein
MNLPSVKESRSIGKILPADLLFAVLVLVFVLLSFFASRQESVTIDEFRHLSTGVHYWQSGDYSFDSATPPLWKMAMALPAYLAGAEKVQFRQLPEIAAGWEPWFVATDFMRDNASAYSSYLQSARLVNLLAAAACLVLLYCRCRRYFGSAAALFGTAFLALTPTFLAHSHYATTDVIATLTLMAVVFVLIDYLQRPALGRLVSASLLLAISLLCKYSALLAAPLLLIVPLLVAMKQEGVAPRSGQRLMSAAMSLGKSLLVVVVTLLLTVNLFYGFKGSGTPLGQLHLESRALSALGQSPAGKLPMPLPRSFIEGFDKQKSDSDYSEFPAYLMGKWSSEGFRSYYLAAFGMKESLPFLILLAAALFSLFRQRWRQLPGRELLLLCYLPLALFLVLSCLNKLNVGVRYLLPAYPFFCLFIAGLFNNIKLWRGARLLLPVLLIMHLVSVFRIAPHYISYFNELSGGAANGYRYLIDSNTDWGQDLPELKKYMSGHGIGKVQLAYFGHAPPELYGINYEPLSASPVPGYIAISASLLQGHPYLLTYLSPPVIAEFGEYGFLRGLQPVGRAGYSIFIYKID